jgi:flagellar protein FliO/FliZ
MEIVFDPPVTGRFFVAFLVVLLFLLMWWLIRGRRFGGVEVGTGGNIQRLAIIDTAAVGRRRQLVLVRRDNIEHLLMIGGPEDIVVEQNIDHAARADSSHEAHGPRERSLAEVMRAVDAALASEGDLGLSWAKASRPESYKRQGRLVAEAQGRISAEPESPQQYNQLAEGRAFAEPRARDSSHLMKPMVR